MNLPGPVRRPSRAPPILLSRCRIRRMKSSQKFRKSGRAMHREVSNIALMCLTFVGLCSFAPMRAIAQAPVTPSSPLSPPINHESGRIEEILTTADGGFRYRGYVLVWRSMRIVVAGAPEESYRSGDNLDVVVSRAEVNGHKVLRFAAGPSASNEDVVDRESTNSSAAMTLGRARIEETISAESEGYRFVGYFVTWHDKRVFVVDPQSAPARAVGETIDFQVWRTGLGLSQRLSFSL